VLISADGRTGNLSSFPQWRQTLSLTYFRPQGIGIASWKIKITLTLPDSVGENHYGVWTEMSMNSV
jgi:hypothetical protein